MKQLVLIAFAFITLSSCHYTRGSGNIISKKVTPGTFTGIDTNGGIEVEFTTGPTFDVRLEADDNIIDRMTAEVHDGILELDIKRLHNTSNIHLKAYVTAPTLTVIKVNGGAEFTAKNIVKSDKIELEANGGGHITAELDAPEVSADANGGAVIDVNGRTKNYTAESNGGGEIISADLMSETTKATANGGGTASVYASSKLVAEADGGGSVRYSGTATVEKSVSGGGSVEKKD